MAGINLLSEYCLPPQPDKHIWLNFQCYSSSSIEYILTCLCIGSLNSTECPERWISCSCQLGSSYTLLLNEMIFLADQHFKSAVIRTGRSSDKILAHNCDVAVLSQLMTSVTTAESGQDKIALYMINIYLHASCMLYFDIKYRSSSHCGHHILCIM